MQTPKPKALVIMVLELEIVLWPTSWMLPVSPLGAASFTHPDLGSHSRLDLALSISSQRIYRNPMAQEKAITEFRHGGR